MASDNGAGYISGTRGDDAIDVIAEVSTAQIHAYAKAGRDLINIIFKPINQFAHAHHVRGDGTGGPDDSTTDRSADTFNFTNSAAESSNSFENIDDVYVGRIEDFDASRDTLEIQGVTISLSELMIGFGTTGGYEWRVVHYETDPTDSAVGDQQWLLIDTGDGYIFYALEGARVTNGDGRSDGQEWDPATLSWRAVPGNYEAHFVGAGNLPRAELTDLEQLPTFGFIDPVNYIPAGYTVLDGVMINDDDNSYADTLAVILGSGFADLIAAGLNDDTVRAGAGSDSVWGGSGNDVLFGQTGDDFIWGNMGDDSSFGGDGNDVLSGGHGNDRIEGGSGADHIEGNEGADFLIGQAGDDVLNGNALSDTLYGGDGDDFINGGFGSDQIVSGSGNDRIYHAGVSGHGSDWVQDFDGDVDVLLLGKPNADSADLHVNFASSANSGSPDVDEAFVIFKATGQILWALVDGAGLERINVQAGPATFDLLA
ncbi:calcium-binding protein [Palleronia pelagia]|uniref:Hemolysin-type calcium-binding repeat-containing protein n=1 Tax=Palleronia pelagia TaxID=387096 RepID=A0A1H8LE78_9RHOB|nr:calcium-binding protein [Palleronia pelagia]SEO03058.1 Hemolysin-type calcium-binding repeat-containing protein [Palleronia pelagia]